MKKPCIKCGATDRYISGKCKPCHKIASKNWRASNPEMSKKGKDIWVCKNKEKEAARKAIWAKNNQDLVRVKNRNRSALKRNSGGAHTANDIRCILALQKSKCACCKTSIKDGYHVDHVIPLSKGGGNDKLNIQLLCPKCNLQKYNKHPIVFMQSRGFLL